MKPRSGDRNTWECTQGCRGHHFVLRGKPVSSSRWTLCLWCEVKPHNFGPREAVLGISKQPPFFVCPEQSSCGFGKILLLIAQEHHRPQEESILGDGWREAQKKLRQRHNLLEAFLPPARVVFQRENPELGPCWPHSQLPWEWYPQKVEFQQQNCCLFFIPRIVSRF